MLAISGDTSLREPCEEPSLTASSGLWQSSVSNRHLGKMPGLSCTDSCVGISPLEIGEGTAVDVSDLFLLCNSQLYLLSFFSFVTLCWGGTENWLYIIWMIREWWWLFLNEMATAYPTIFIRLLVTLTDSPCPQISLCCISREMKQSNLFLFTTLTWTSTCTIHHTTDWRHYALQNGIHVNITCI